MFRLTCPKCRFSMKLPEHQVSGRPTCPKCNAGLMELGERDQRKVSGGWKRKKTEPGGTRPGVVRNLILGIVLLLVRTVLIVWAASRWDRAGAVAAVFMGHGIVLMGWGIVLLVRAALRKSD